MSDWLGIFWLVVLLIANAFFVGAEFAVISARRSQIEPKAEAGSKRAKTALWAMEHVSLMLATSQLGITVASLLILNVSEPAIHHLAELALVGTGMSDAWITGISFTFALVLVTFLHVMESDLRLSDMLPRDVKHIEDALAAQATRYLEDVKTRFRAGGSDVVTDIATGRAAEVICRYAKEHGFDLIVMATHGRSGLSKLLLGSVTGEVVACSGVPVLAVPPGSCRPDH